MEKMDCAPGRCEEGGAAEGMLLREGPDSMDISSFSLDMPDEIVEEEDNIPPERVRFTAPAVIRPEGSETSYDGAVLNLSTRGVALVAPWAAKASDRVWLRFRLGLGEEPLNLLCEVIWCAPQTDEDWLCGLRFSSLTREEDQRVQVVVSERSEGRAAEWPLPVMPVPTPNVSSRQPSPWLSAVAGMAAGIGLALALSVIPSAGVGGPGPAKQAVTSGLVEATTESSASAGVMATPTTVAAPSVEPSGAAHAAVASETAMAFETKPAAPSPATEDAKPAAEDPAPAAAASKPISKNLPRLSKAPLETGPGQDVLRPLGTADGVEMALLADGPVQDHVAFWLASPKRLVVDLFGRRSGFTEKRYQVDHPLVRQVRVGQHPNKVRFVIEIAESVSNQVQTRVVGNSVMVELRRQ